MIKLYLFNIILEFNSSFPFIKKMKTRGRYKFQIKLFLFIVECSVNDINYIFNSYISTIDIE